MNGRNFLQNLFGQKFVSIEVPGIYIECMIYFIIFQCKYTYTHYIRYDDMIYDI